LAYLDDYLHLAYRGVAGDPLLNQHKKSGGGPYLGHPPHKYAPCFVATLVNALLFIFVQNQVNMVCPPFAELGRNYRVLSDKGVSETTVLFGTIEKKSVVLKIFAQSTSTKRGLQTELKIYKKVLGLVRKHWTPNVVRLVGDWVCARDEIPPHVPLPKYDSNYGVLVTERIQGPSLGRKLARLADKDVYSIIFQTAHALAMLSLAGIRHADLHIDNVLLATGRGHTEYVFRGQHGLVYSLVPTQWMVKIFDWDHGDLANDPNPATAAVCRRADMCGVNAKADLFRFLHFIWHETPSRGVIAFIESLVDPLLLQAAVPDGLYEKRGGEAHQFCRGPLADECPARATAKQCLGKWSPPDCLMPSPRRVMEDPLYEQWRSRPVARAWGSKLKI